MSEIRVAALGLERRDGLCEGDGGARCSRLRETSAGHAPDADGLVPAAGPDFFHSSLLLEQQQAADGVVVMTRSHRANKLSRLAVPEHDGLIPPAAPDASVVVDQTEDSSVMTLNRLQAFHRLWVPHFDGLIATTTPHAIFGGDEGMNDSRVGLMGIDQLVAVIDVEAIDDSIRTHQDDVLVQHHANRGTGLELDVLLVLLSLLVPDSNRAIERAAPDVLVHLEKTSHFVRMTFQL